MRVIKGLNGRTYRERQLTPEEREQRKTKAVELRQQGWSYQAIANELGCGQGTAFRILNEQDPE